MSKKPFLILIGGGTSSGKGAVAEKLGTFLSLPFHYIGTDDFVTIKLNVKGVI